LSKSIIEYNSDLDFKFLLINKIKARIKFLKDEMDKSINGKLRNHEKAKGVVEFINHLVRIKDIDDFNSVQILIK